MAATPAPTRDLSLIEIAALSIALIGPSLVLAANAQAIPAGVTQPIWLIFLVGLVGIATVGHAFIRLLPLTDGPGSAYRAVQVTLGAAPGRLAGVALLGAYLGFSLATPAAILSFAASVFPAAVETAVGKLICLSLAMGAAALIVTRPNATIMRTLLLVEGGGIVLILVLGAAIGLRGEAALTPSPLPAAGTSHLLDGVVVAFFSWAGFESCMTLADSSRNPARDMPRALIISILGSGLFFVAMFAAIESGFAHLPGGRSALASSANALSDLGAAYLGPWAARGFGVVAICSAFACAIAAITASGAMWSSLTATRRDPHRMALKLVIAVWALESLLILAQPLVPAIPASPIALYGLFGSSGAVCIMLAYLLVLSGFAVALARRHLSLPRAEIIVPICGIAFLLFALASTVSFAGDAALPSWLALLFSGLCFAGLSLRNPAPTTLQELS
ncbi:APC family permease [Novosphingobium rosa]|uniref:APC family permease n=1 Tax=Novosphingobium rosa TaxID=76978 RepID=UPI0008374FED|nr:APC family permease [Novosphingobium rosa]